MRNSHQQSSITVARKHSTPDAPKRKPQRPLRNKKTPKHMPKGMEKCLPVWGMRVLPQGVEPSIIPPLAGELDGGTYTEVSFNSNGTLRPIDISPSSLQIPSPSLTSASRITSRTPSLSFTACSPDSPSELPFAQPELSSKQHDSWDNNADLIYGPANDVMLPSYYNSIESHDPYSASLQGGTLPPPVIPQIFHIFPSEDQYHKNPHMVDCPSNGSYFSVSSDSLLGCNAQSWSSMDLNHNTHIYSPSPHSTPATSSDYGLSEELTNSSPTFTATRESSITNFQFPFQLDALDSLTLTRSNPLNTSQGPSTLPCESRLDIYLPNWLSEPYQYPQTHSIDYFPHIHLTENTLAPPSPRYPFWEYHNYTNPFADPPRLGKGLSTLNSYENQEDGISSIGILGNRNSHDSQTICFPMDNIVFRM